MDDSGIIDLFFARSEQAIQEVRNKYGPYCSSVAIRILDSASDSEECVADTWMKAWETIPPARPENLQAYLGKITRNHALQRLRAANAKKRGGSSIDLALSELDDCVSDGDTPEDNLIRRQLSESINRFLKTLPAEKRVVFVLRYWYMYSIKEIASQTGMRESTVSSVLFRLRKKLKTHLEQEDISI